MRRIAIASLGVAVVASVGLVAPSQADAQDSEIIACVNRFTGRLRIIDPLEVCRNWEYELVWNQDGVPGPQGEKGAKGDKGDPGESAPFRGRRVRNVIPDAFAVAGFGTRLITTTVTCDGENEVVYSGSCRGDLDAIRESAVGSFGPKRDEDGSFKIWECKFILRNLDGESQVFTLFTEAFCVEGEVLP